MHWQPNRARGKQSTDILSSVRVPLVQTLLDSRLRRPLSQAHGDLETPGGDPAQQGDECQGPQDKGPVFQVLPHDVPVIRGVT